MKIDARITNLMLGDSNVKAIASVNLDGCFAIRNIRVMSGKNGLFISMPSVKEQDGGYTDICLAICLVKENKILKSIMFLQSLFV